jgi:hypothetical protein
MSRGSHRDGPPRARHGSGRVGRRRGARARRGSRRKSSGVARGGGGDEDPRIVVAGRGER